VSEETKFLSLTMARIGSNIKRCVQAGTLHNFTKTTQDNERRQAVLWRSNDEF